MKLLLHRLLLALPTAVTWVVLVLGLALIAIQVRLEEEYLLRMYGETYRCYQPRTRRWL